MTPFEKVVAGCLVFFSIIAITGGMIADAFVWHSIAPAQEQPAITAQLASQQEAPVTSQQTQGDGGDILGSRLGQRGVGTTQYRRLIPADNAYIIQICDPPPSGLGCIPKTVVTIEYDGSVVFGEGFTADDAAREFWKYMGASFPYKCACEQGALPQ